MFVTFLMRKFCLYINLTSLYKKLNRQPNVSINNHLKKSSATLTLCIHLMCQIWFPLTYFKTHWQKWVIKVFTCVIPETGLRCVWGVPSPTHQRVTATNVSPHLGQLTNSTRVELIFTELFPGTFCCVIFRHLRQ